jgi:hypothetical protein
MVTPDEQALFEQLGRNQVFRAWLQKESDTRIKVLKVNTRLEQLCQAQGAMQVLDAIQALTERRTPA